MGGVGGLVVTGYGFEPVLGRDWITEPSGRFLREYARLCRELSVTGIISHPEHDAATGLLHYTLFVFGKDGRTPAPPSARRSEARVWGVRTSLDSFC